MQQWAVFNLNMATPWPSENQEIEFGGRLYLLIAQAENRHPAVAVERIPLEPWDDAWTSISRFLSALCWATEGSFATFTPSGGMAPTAMDGFDKHRFYFSPYHTPGKFHFAAMPVVTADQARALAYWREACSLEWASASYSLLSFFKVIEGRFSGGATRAPFVAAAVSSIEASSDNCSGRARDEVTRLTELHNEVPLFLGIRALSRQFRDVGTQSMLSTRPAC